MFVQGVGLVGATADQTSVPMASVTKVMTAIIVLRDHPLGDGSGPTFTMTAANHAAWIHDATHDDSNLDVVAGEHLTERQLLEALMIPSADNIADYLARWDAGSIPAFVKKMNAMAEGARPEGHPLRGRERARTRRLGARQSIRPILGCLRDERARHDLGRRSPDHGLPRRG